jgi:hypothetical protein
MAPARDWLCTAPNRDRAREEPTGGRPMKGTTARVGQIALGVFWLTDGILNLQPYLQHHLAGGVIDPKADGQPAIIGHTITWVGGVVAPHQPIFALAAALIHISIGLGLLMPRTVKPALLLSFCFAATVWLFGEGLGGLFTGVAPDPLTGVLGPAPLYVIAGLLVWPRSGGSQPEFGLLGEIGARAVWAALWLGAAAEWLFPSNASADAVHAMLTTAPSGAGWLTSLESTAAGLVGHTGSTAALVLAVISAEIGLSVLWARGVRIALFTSMLVSVLGWFLVEGMGGLFTGQATDIGMAPLMILIAALLLPLAPGRSSVASEVISTDAGRGGRVFTLRRQPGELNPRTDP